MLYAHYTATKTAKTLYISKDVAGREVVSKHAVSGKREANQLAAKLNAKPWNF